MARSKEKNRRVILDTAFKVFSDRTIEAVTFNDIAAEAGIGVATVFRHFENKTDLAVAVCSDQWAQYLESFYVDRPIETVADIPAIDRFEYGLQLYVNIYRDRKELLKYNDNFNHYMHSRATEGAEMDSYWRAVEPMRERFHLIYEEAKKDKTMRTDIPEGELFRVTFHTMIAVCHHYAGGFLWGADPDKDKDYIDEVIKVKNMIYDYVKC